MKRLRQGRTEPVAVPPPLHPVPEVRQARSELARYAVENVALVDDLHFDAEFHDLCARARVVMTSTWPWKLGGSSKCMVCKRKSVSGRSLCGDHLDWSFLSIHHSWTGAELRRNVVQALFRLAGESLPESTDRISEKFKAQFNESLCQCDVCGEAVESLNEGKGEYVLCPTHNNWRGWWRARRINP